MNNVVTISCASLALADGNRQPGGAGWCEELSLDGQRQIETSMPLRALDVSVFARGNRAKTVSFKISTQYRGSAYATANAFAWDDYLPDQADLIIGLNDGTDNILITLPATGWKAVKIPANDMRGRTVTIEYTCVAGIASVVVNGSPLLLPGILQLLLESQIDPLVIPANTVANVPSGSLLVARSIQIDGELDLAGELCLIGEN